MRAFLLGAAAIGAVTYVFAAGLALVVAASGSTLHLGLGPLVLVSVDQEGSSTTTVIGFGLIVVAVVGGLVNVLAAHLVGRRRDREPIT